MFVITHRSIVFSAAALFTVLTSAAAAQEAQSTSDPSRGEPASQSDVTAGDDDDAALVLAEPDFRVLNLPSTLRLPRPRIELPAHPPVQRQSSARQLQRECRQSVRARSGSGGRFRVPVRHRAASASRCLSHGDRQDLPVLRQVRRRAPGRFDPGVALGARLGGRCGQLPGTVFARVGPGRFTNGRPTGSRVYATPVWVHNTAAILNIDRDTFFVGIGGRVRVSSTVYVVGEVAPRAGGYSPDKPAYGFAIEKRAGGHLFQLNFNNGQGTTFGQLARGGFSDSLYLGFNLARKFF